LAVVAVEKGVAEIGLDNVNPGSPFRSTFEGVGIEQKGRQASNGFPWLVYVRIKEHAFLDITPTCEHACGELFQAYVRGAVWRANAEYLTDSDSGNVGRYRTGILHF
jgi:hypothetical protein